MFSPIEPDVFPPDICYSGDINLSSEWKNPSDSRMENHNIVESQSNAFEEENIKDSIADNNQTIDNSNIEGAVGITLPDLCVNVSNASSQAFSCDDIKLEISEKLIEKENLSKNSDRINCCDIVKNEFESVDEEILIKSSDYLVHNCKHICLVACGTGDLQFQPFIPEKDKNHEEVYGAESQLSMCCDKSGALENLNDLQKYGFDIIRHNLLQSSHSMFHKWDCSAYISMSCLSPVSLLSHGTSLGQDIGSAYVMGFPFGSPSMNEDSNSSEEEQIKVSKRFGLIQHLPCGIFDGSTKTRECVICMIDFSKGEKIRYLPCMHTYHTHCIDDWLIRSFTCPSCLEPVDAALLNTYETS